eukprot:SAG22_NODE_225_length_14728_cov_58.742361_15_plen_161_part_00
MASNQKLRDLRKDKASATTRYRKLLDQQRDMEDEADMQVISAGAAQEDSFCSTQELGELSDDGEGGDDDDDDDTPILLALKFSWDPGVVPLRFPRSMIWCPGLEVHPPTNTAHQQAQGSLSQRQSLGLLQAEPGPFTGRAWAFYRQSLGLLQADGSVSKP